MKRVAAAVLVGLVVVATSMVFATNSEAGCTSNVYFRGPFKIVEKECYNHRTGVTKIKKTRINRHTGRVVVTEKVIDAWGHVRETERVVRHGRPERHHHWRDSRWARWDRHHHRR